MRLLPSLFFLLFISSAVQANASVTAPTDTLEIIKLNKLGYESRLINPNQTIRYGQKALELSKKANFLNGLAEAYRVLGIGKSYQNESERAFEYYLNSLGYFQKAKNQEGEARVYNNIGNLYRSIDNDKSLEYFSKSLRIAQNLQNKELIAGLSLNMGTIYQKEKQYNQALESYKKSLNHFAAIKNLTGEIQCMQNIGVTLYTLNRLSEAEKYLIEAIKNAKQNDLNFLVASTNLTLSSVYIAEDRFESAEKSIKEGINFAKLVEDSRMEYDFLFTSFELENKRKNYQQALQYLKQVYKQDSLNYKSNESVKLNLQDKQFRQQAKQLENDRIILEQKYAFTLFWASTAVAALALLAIFLLIRNNRKSAKTNKQLLQLNKEVSQQKEDLDRINHSLEEIIDERTLDLKIKNNKLSEYSSHLSHQIRSPVATIKGLLILETDNLIEHDELVEQLQVCVQDIDNKILNINENLNNNTKFSLSS
jgi:tetratricopeptide (TPR) repeat protein